MATLQVLRRLNNASRSPRVAIASTVLAMVSPAAMALCEDAVEVKDPVEEVEELSEVERKCRTPLVPHDDEGHVQWGRTFTQVGDGAFWDIVATKAGHGVQKVVDSGHPTQISYGFIAGWSSGFALQKAGKVAAGVFGLGFMALQSLAYSGYIKVDHGEIRQDIEAFFDVNNDGKIDKEDASLIYDKLMDVLTYNLPGGSGFAMGFAGGIRA